MPRARIGKEIKVKLQQVGMRLWEGRGDNSNVGTIRVNLRLPRVRMGGRHKAEP